MEFLTKPNITLIILGLALLSIVIGFWRAHQIHGNNFNILDLVMADGKVSRVGTAFMIVLLVSSWVIVHKQLTHELDSATFGLWLTAWVGPLVARILKGGKGDAVLPVPAKKKA